MAFGANIKSCQTGIVTLVNGQGTTTLAQAVNPLKSYVDLRPCNDFLGSGDKASALNIYLSNSTTVTVTSFANWTTQKVAFVVFEYY